MTKEQAIEILSKATSQMSLPLQVHMQILEALKVLNSLEPKKGE